MVEWTKAAAVRRMRSNQALKDIIKIEPRIQSVIDIAKQQENEPGYHRIKCYYQLKAQVESLVGWHATKAAIKTQAAWDTVIRTIDDLLPPDDVDLYPDGRPNDE